MVRYARCRSCGAPMLWVTMHPSGKPNPLDPTPVEWGNIEVRDGLQTTSKYGRVVPQGEREGKLYTSHFATCPNAGEHRKR